jgi:hypothetical protein
MSVELSQKERQLLLQLVDEEILWLRGEETSAREGSYKEELHTEEAILTEIVQKLSKENSDLKEPVREDHDALEKTKATHNHDF